MSGKYEPNGGPAVEKLKFSMTQKKLGKCASWGTSSKNVTPRDSRLEPGVPAVGGLKFSMAQKKIQKSAKKCLNRLRKYYSALKNQKL